MFTVVFQALVVALRSFGFICYSNSCRSTYIFLGLWFMSFLFLFVLFNFCLLVLCASSFSHSMHVGCWCVYGRFCRIQRDGLTLHCFFSLMHYNVLSLCRTVVATVFLSVKCRISTDTGCTGRRQPLSVYHEKHGVETVSVGWVNDRFNQSIFKPSAWHMYCL